MPMYWMRAIGGTLYLIGMFTLVYNIIQTLRNGSNIEDELAEACFSKNSKEELKGEISPLVRKKTYSVNHFGN
jgi:cytochrome c oxidase cbb3-type subunit I/II